MAATNRYPLGRNDIQSPKRKSPKLRLVPTRPKPGNDNPRPKASKFPVTDLRPPTKRMPISRVALPWSPGNAPKVGYRFAGKLYKATLFRFFPHIDDVMNTLDGLVARGWRNNISTGYKWCRPDNPTRTKHSGWSASTCLNFSTKPGTVWSSGKKWWHIGFLNTVNTRFYTHEMLEFNPKPNPSAPPVLYPPVMIPIGPPIGLPLFPAPPITPPLRFPQPNSPLPESSVRGWGGSFGGGYPPIIARPMPPEPGVKERKFKKGIKGLASAGFAGLAGLSEINDGVDSFYGAISARVRKEKLFKKMHGRGRNMGERALFVFENFDKVDMGKALYNVAKNELEDNMVGRLIGAHNRAMKRLGARPHVANFGLRTATRGFFY